MFLTKIPYILVL